MRKLFYLLVPLFVFLSCSSDDDKQNIDFDDFNLEIVNEKVHKPIWLKDIISSQTVESDIGSFFPGHVYGIEVDNEKYIIVSNMLSSNMCQAMQLYHLDGEKVLCDHPIVIKLFTEEWKKHPHKLLWDGSAL